ncbi:MAG: DUF4169 family protein [Hyphomonadaceae bacterium]|nr:DUF4169 family protein [Hyphomonadaceae bacterium]
MQFIARQLGHAAAQAYIDTMGEVVNLRRARKAKQRSEADAAAAENRASFGRSKAEKEQTNAEREAASRKLDGHKRDDDNL